MLIEVESKKSLQEIDASLKEAAARHKFGVLGVHDLKQKLADKGVDFGPDCLVYEVCNPQQAKKVLEANGAVSTALPCRISVFGKSGKYTIATMKPTEMLKAFDMPGMEQVAREVETEIESIMRESA